MAAKRKDKNGRLLKTGENQRKDLLYQYRYQDIWGKTKYIYSTDLDDLRQKEKEVQKELEKGVDYAKGNVSVEQLVERYIGLKQNVRYNTKVGYQFVLNLLKKETFSQKCIRDIKVSDAQMWMIKLANDGKGYSTLTSVRGVLRPAFQMAYNEDIIPKNPFDFKLTDVIVNNSQKRIALTDAQRDTWMEFIRTDPTYSKYYDEFVVLLHTGLRVSEFCGLTLKDLDFENRRITVDHQLIRERSGRYYVEVTKSESGKRYIAMDDAVYTSLKNMLEHRPKVKTEILVDGYSGFIMLDKNGRPKVALHIENEMRWAMKKYDKLHPDAPLPNITPHVLRHTFCTDLHFKGLDPKSLQYFMGHSESRTTMNIYTHANYEQARDALTKVLRFSGRDGEGKSGGKAL